MLRNISYNDHKLKEEITKKIGQPFSFFERIKMNGIGSSNLKIQRCRRSVVITIPSRKRLKHFDAHFLSSCPSHKAQGLL